MDTREQLQLLEYLLADVWHRVGWQRVNIFPFPASSPLSRPYVKAEPRSMQACYILENNVYLTSFCRLIFPRLFEGVYKPKLRWPFIFGGLKNQKDARSF